MRVCSVAVSSEGVGDSVAGAVSGYAGLSATESSVVVEVDNDSYVAAAAEDESEWYECYVSCM